MLNEAEIIIYFFTIIVLHTVVIVNITVLQDK